MKWFKKLFYKNILTANSNKTDLDELDECLLEFLRFIKCTNYGFFHKDVWKNHRNEKCLGIAHAISKLFVKSRKSNHHKIAIQLLVKKITKNKVSYEEYEFYNHIFKCIITYYDLNYIVDLMSEWCNIDNYFFYSKCFNEIRIYSEHIKWNYSNYYDNDWFNTQNNGYNKYYDKRTKSNHKTSNSSSDSILVEHFKVLGISKTSDLTLIKKTYRKLCLKHHPDKGGRKEDFIKITNSYEYIINNI